MPGLPAGLAEIWRDTFDLQLARLALLEQAGSALVLDGRVEPGVLEGAAHAAHTLAGSLGVFGFHEGSRIVRSLETLLDGKGPGPSDARRFSELVVALRREMSQDPQVEDPPDVKDADWFLIFDPPPDRGAELAAVATTRGLRAEVFTDASAARRRAAGERPGLALLFLRDGSGDALYLLEFLAKESPLVAVASGADGLFDRVEAARRGAALFLPDSLDPASCVDEVLKLRARSSGLGRILAVDDDRVILASVDGVLSAQGHQVTTLDDPHRFLDELDRVSPDVLLLDVDMPDVSGLELLRVARNDARRTGLGVLMLTARTDVQTILKAFAWGADDFLTKPISFPELIVRVRNRIERVRQGRASALADTLTGLTLRPAAEDRLRDLVARAERLGEPISVLALGVPGLPNIATTSGGRAVELALRRVADALASSRRGEDVVARWNDHEFVASLSGLGLEEAMDLAGDLVERLSASSLSASVGVASAPDAGRGAPELVEAALSALREGGREGGGRVHPAPARPGRPSLDVALVDDDDAVSAVVVRALQTRGYSVTRFADGEAACAALCGESPPVVARLVLLDVDLPGLNGLALLRRLQTDGVLNGTNVIMLTARSVEAEVLEALELGAQDHVSKPFSLPVLLQRVRRVLKRR